MFPKTIVKILVVLLAVILTSAAAAQSQEVLIRIPRDHDSVFTVYPGQVVVLQHGWGAASPGLIQSYINALNQEFTLNGVPLFTSSREARQYWGPIEPYAGVFPPPYYCPRQPEETIPSRYWRYRLSSLQPGDYLLHYILWVDRPLIDGCDWDGDGHVDHVSDWRLEGTLTIRVVQ